MPVGVLIALTEVCVCWGELLTLGGTTPTLGPELCGWRKEYWAAMIFAPLCFLTVFHVSCCIKLLMSRHGPHDELYPWMVEEYTLTFLGCFVRVFPGSKDGACCSHSTCLFSTWTVPFPCDLLWLAPWHSFLWSFMKDLRGHCDSNRSTL